MKKATPTRLPDRKKTGRLHQELPLHLMLLPGLVIILIYNYAPMFGLLMAFENYKPTKGIFGSAWVGLENFIRPAAERKLQFPPGFSAVPAVHPRRKHIGTVARNIVLRLLSESIP